MVQKPPEVKVRHIKRGKRLKDKVVNIIIEAKSLSHVRLFVTPWTVACQAPLSRGFSRQEILEWVAMPSSRGSSPPRDGTHISCIAGRFLPTEALEKLPPGYAYSGSSLFFQVSPYYHPWVSIKNGKSVSSHCIMY